VNRAWKFFQPVPIDPRVRSARPPSTRPAERFAAWASTGIFAVVAGYFGWELLRHGAVLDCAISSHRRTLAAEPRCV